MTDTTKPTGDTIDDEVAAVRAAAHDRLCRVMAGENANEMGSRRQYANRILDAGWTDRRPVDTRPDDRKTVSEYKNVTRKVRGYLANGDTALRAMLEAGVIIPDPAPAAEVPVFASVEEAEAWLDGQEGTWAINRHSVGTWAAGYYNPHMIHYTKPLPTQLEALQALAAALTKATDR